MNRQKACLDQSLVEIFDTFKATLPNCGIAWLWEQPEYTPDIYTALFAESPDEIADIAPENLFHIAIDLHKDNEWIEDSITLDATQYKLYIFSVSITDTTSSIITLLAPPDGSKPEINEELLYMFAKSMGLKRCLNHTLEEIDDLQNHMRYQVVWSECIEWTKNIIREDPSLYSELLTRLVIISNSSQGAILVQGKPELNAYKGGEKEELEEKFTQFKTRKEIEEIRGYQVENNEYKILAADRKTPYDHVLVGPARSAARNRNALIILFKSADKDPYSITDRAYIEQIISSVFMGLDKNSLMRALARSNKALKQERETQKELIQQLQEAQEQLLQSEKLASIGQLAAGVAHEINNPIGFVKTNITVLGSYSKTLLDKFKQIRQRLVNEHDQSMLAFFDEIAEEIELEDLEEDLPDLLEDANDGISRVSHIVQDLKDFSRTDSGNFELCDLHSPINKALNIAHNEIKYKVEVETNFADLPQIEIVAPQISQVVLNFVVNAAHAIEEKGTITITTKQVLDDFVEFSITDTGKGIEQEHLKKIFDPFFTTKPIGKGTGLGLSLSYGIIQRHHGNIQVTSEIGVGTTFTTILPIRQPTEGEIHELSCG
ncbi:sensor histidine kinase [Litoribrevibacter euphylliae]|uniref:histidine kinase n=1 Tax=Litoribrevibacter euphylliae TaxID=1834034 RepID=A0ABV7HCT5_9GAMM